MRENRLTWISAAAGAMLALLLATSAGAQERQDPVSSPKKKEPMVPIREVFAPEGDFDPRRFGKVAVVQWNPSGSAPVGVSAADAEAYKMANRRALERYIREAVANGAEMVITPEFGLIGYPDIPELPDEEDSFRSRDDIAPYVERVPSGPSTRYFARLARELRIWLQVGFVEVDPATDQYFNVAVAFDPTGRLVARFRKINLFELENQFLSPGRDMVTYDTPFGRVGIVICADIYSWHPMEALRRAGVQVLALSTSWAQMNTGMKYFRDGARWVNAFVLAANQRYFPDSGVVNPDGSLQSHIRQSMGVAYGYLPRVAAPARRGLTRR